MADGLKPNFTLFPYRLLVVHPEIPQVGILCTVFLELHNQTGNLGLTVLLQVSASLRHHEKLEPVIPSTLRWDHSQRHDMIGTMMRDPEKVTGPLSASVSLSIRGLEQTSWEVLSSCGNVRCLFHCPPISYFIKALLKKKAPKLSSSQINWKPGAGFEHWILSSLLFP